MSGSGLLRILTWNVWGRHGVSAERRHAVESWLAGLSPDLCTLQEVWLDGGRSALSSLAARMELFPVEGPRLREPHAHNVILSRWPIAEQASVLLPSALDNDPPRSAVLALVEHPAGRLPVFTTQLHSSPTGSAVRCRQVRALAEFIAAHRGDLPALVTGDFNAEPDSDEMRLLGGHKTSPPIPGFGLLDSWRYASSAPGWTWDPANPHVAESFDVGARIDYILTEVVPGRRRIGSVRLVANAPVHGVWPSDHAGVLAEVRPC